MSSGPESVLDSRDRFSERATTGIDGLDYILGGGFPRNRLFLIEGHPGSGKTTLGLQFLLEGRKKGESGLCVALSENKEELELVAASHGWSLDGIDLYELEKLEDQFKPETQYTVFHPGEVELGYTTNQIRRTIEKLKPVRVVFDSLSELRLLAEDPLRFRREILGIKQFLAECNCTTLLLDDIGYNSNEPQVRSIVHGVLLLERVPTEFGASRRRISIVKMRGVKFRDGLHDLGIVTGGLVVYPRLASASERVPHSTATFSSGIAELDKLLDGGLDRATSTAIIGPAGCGKSTLSTLYAFRAAERGGVAACYLFEESRDTFLDRARGFGMELDKYIDDGKLVIQQVDPAEMSAGEFSQTVRRAVNKQGASVVIIDSLNGYLNAMPSERYLLMHMHELFSYLQRQGVLTILIVAQHGLLGSVQTPVDITYLADTVIVLRYFESGGEVKQALSVIKKRKGSHERTIREMRFTRNGIRIGRPLREFQGILTGVPVFTGGEQEMLPDENGDE